MALWRAWVMVSDLSKSLGSYPLVLIVGLFITAILMYSCGRKFIEFDGRSKNLSYVTKQRRGASSSEEAKGALVEKDVKKRRKRSKKWEKQQTEAVDEECPTSQEENKNSTNSTEPCGKAVPDNGSEAKSTEGIISATERPRLIDREKQAGDVADGSMKNRRRSEPDSRKMKSPDQVRNSPSNKRGCPGEYSRTIARGKGSQDAHGDSERIRSDSLPTEGGKFKEGKMVRRGKLSDHRSKRNQPDRDPVEDFRRSPRNSRRSVDDGGSLEREVQKTDKLRHLSSGRVNDEAGDDGKQTKSILKKSNQEGALKLGFSNGRFQKPPGRLQGTKSNENQNITSVKPGDVAQEIETLHSNTKQQFKKPASKSSSVENRRGESTNQQRSARRNGPRFVKIEVNPEKDTGVERCGNLLVSEQEQCTSSRVAKDVFTRTESLDSGYSEEIASPTGALHEGDCVFGSEDDMLASNTKRNTPVKTSRTRANSASEPKASTKTERRKQGTVSVECILRHLQSPSHQSWSGKQGRLHIDPEVRERIANPKHRVRMPDKPFEHLSLAMTNRNRTKRTNTSHVEGIFGRKWRETLHKELDRQESSDDSAEEDDTACDLRDDICPVFMMWGVCRQGEHCGLRHPSCRYLDPPAKTPVRLPQEETEYDPISYAAILQREKDTQPEIFHNDALTSPDKITLGESEPSYSRALCQGKVGQQRGSIQTVVRKEQSFEEAWPALESAAKPTGSNKLPPARKSKRAVPKSVQDPSLESEEVKRFAESLHNVFNQSVVDETNREEHEKSDYKEEDYYETNDHAEEIIVRENVNWSDYQQDAVKNDAERSSSFHSDVIITEDSAGNKTPTPGLEVVSTLCNICMDRPKDATLVCGHRFCYLCALQMRLDERVCAVCRRCIVSVIKTYN